MNKEERRLELQTYLDSERSSEARNKLGQYATPPDLARAVSAYALDLLPSEKCLNILEPSCGSGSFISAIAELRKPELRHMVGIELDPRFAEASRELWQHEATVINADFFDWLSSNDKKFDLIVANPPYVRHHHLSSELKTKYNSQAAHAAGAKISKLAGLYVYFMLAAKKTMSPGAVATWLIPSEVLGVNYGSAVREFLCNSVTLDRIHLFEADDSKFDDALVTSCVITFINSKPSKIDLTKFTVGSSYSSPTNSSEVSNSILRQEHKWGRLFPHITHDAGEVHKRVGDLFKIRRGIATGNNAFFIKERAEFNDIGVPDEFLRPILASPRTMKDSEIFAETTGWPIVPAQLALLDCPANLEEDALPAEVRAYLDSASEDVRGAFLVKSRKPWFKQEQRPAAPIICTYMGRSRGDTKPFRFIRNRSEATVTNTYLALYPKQDFRDLIQGDIEKSLDIAWQALSEISSDALAYTGREYGGGLKKMEPKELANLPADSLLDRIRSAGLLDEGIRQGAPMQPALPF